MSNILTPKKFYELPNGEAFHIDGGVFVTDGPARYFRAPIPEPINWGFYTVEGLDFSDVPYIKYLYLTAERFLNFINKRYPNVFAEEKTVQQPYDYSKLQGEVNKLTVARKAELTALVNSSFEGILLFYYPPESYAQYLFITRDNPTVLGHSDTADARRENTVFFQSIIDDKIQWVFKDNFIMSYAQFMSDAEIYFYSIEYKRVHGKYPDWMDKCIVHGFDLCKSMNEKMIKVLNLR